MIKYNFRNVWNELVSYGRTYGMFKETVEVKV